MQGAGSSRSGVSRSIGLRINLNTVSEASLIAENYWGGVENESIIPLLPTSMKYCILRLRVELKLSFFGILNGKNSAPFLVPLVCRWQER